MAGVNQGVIASLFSCSIIFSAILFYLIYGEKLTQRHFIGIFFMTISVVLISLGNSSSKPSSSSSANTISANNSTNSSSSSSN